MVKFQLPTEDDELYEDELYQDEDVQEDEEIEEQEEKRGIPTLVKAVIGVVASLVIGAMLLWLMPKPPATVVTETTTSLVDTTSTTVAPSDEQPKSNNGPTVIAQETIAETIAETTTTKPVATIPAVIQETQASTAQSLTPKADLVEAYVQRAIAGQMATPMGVEMQKAYQAGYTSFAYMATGNDVEAIFKKGNEQLTFVGMYDPQTQTVQFTDRQGFIVQTR